MNTTQYVIIGVFIFFAIVGVVVFAGFGASNQTGSTTLNVSIWGTIPQLAVTRLVETINEAKPGTIVVDYQEFPSNNFESILTEALAEGTGPDIVIMPHPFLARQERKLLLIPWTSYSEALFKDSFVEAGEVFTTNSGTYALPFLVDPIVMYWNRDTFNSKSISKPPQLWGTVKDLAEKLTEVSDKKVIKKSTVAFGEYQNVVHTKEILSALIFQAGNPIVKRDVDGLDNVLNNVPDGAEMSGFDAAVSYYTQFADPLQPFYSWNRSLPTSEQMFLSGDLALYFGFASELRSLKEKNPNLNFGVATLPQAESAGVKATYGNVFGMAILGNSANKQGAFQAVMLLTGAGPISLASSLVGLPPVRRDLLAVLPGTASGDVFWKSALWAKAWLDPNPERTNLALKEMLESITSGRSRYEEATQLFVQKLDEELR